MIQGLALVMGVSRCRQALPRYAPGSERPCETSMRRGHCSASFTSSLTVVSRTVRANELSSGQFSSRREAPHECYGER